MPATRVLIPEVVEADSEIPMDLVALRRFAILMDAAVPIPGTRRRVGLDAAIGFIPGLGDVIGGALSAWVVVGALRYRVPMPRVLRMVGNILADVALGSIPIFGDIFDLFFEENIANVEILIRARDRSRPPRTLGGIAVAAAALVSFIVGASIIIAALVIIAIIWLIRNRGAL
jgi:Domain of unknown function (DUF4112)